MTALTDNCTIEDTTVTTERIPLDVSETKCPVFFLVTQDFKTGFELLDSHAIALLGKFLS